MINVVVALVYAIVVHYAATLVVHSISDDINISKYVN